MARDFMTDPGQLRDLEGQQYVVLRPTGAVMREWDRTREAAHRRLSETVRYPGAAHVTLRGLCEPDRVDQVRAVVGEYHDIATSQIWGISGYQHTARRRREIGGLFKTHGHRKHEDLVVDGGCQRRTWRRECQVGDGAHLDITSNHLSSIPSMSRCSTCLVSRRMRLGSSAVAITIAASSRAPIST